MHPKSLKFSWIFFSSNPIANSSNETELRYTRNTTTQAGCITNKVAYLGFYFVGGGEGWGQNVFGKVGVFGYLHGAKPRVASGVWGHAPPRKFLKMLQFGAFWRIFC